MNKWQWDRTKWKRERNRNVYLFWLYPELCQDIPTSNLSSLKRATQLTLLREYHCFREYHCHWPPFEFGLKFVEQTWQNNNDNNNLSSVLFPSAKWAEIVLLSTFLARGLIEKKMGNIWAKNLRSMNQKWNINPVKCLFTYRDNI